jgi:hypothetical protein
MDHVMNKILSGAIGAALLVACLVLAAPARAGGPSAAVFPPKSPLRYHVLRYSFSTTTNITDAIVGALPPGGAVLKDVVITQFAAGTGGTSWVVTPKRAAASLCSTDGGFTLAAGASKVTNSAKSPMGAFTNPTGGTRPVISGDVAASGTATIASGLTATEKITIQGVDFTAVASGATGNQFNLGADENAAAANLAAAINASTSPAVRGAVTASAASAVVTITARTPGTGGNAITLTRTGAHITVSGSGTLASGFNAMSSGGELVTADITLTGSYSGAVSGVVTMYFESRY